MTLTRGQRALLICLFGLALLPGAMAVNPSSAPSTPAVAQLDPVPPLKADKPTNEEQANLNARGTWERHRKHFQCAQYPPQDTLMPTDLVPTGNASATIAVDRSGAYQVTAVDYPKIIIGHKAITRTYSDTGRRYTLDHYTWRYPKGVELFGVFMRNVDKDGEVYWSRLISPLERADGTYELTEIRGGDTKWIAIVGTDTTTCAPGIELPSGMWNKVQRILP